MAKTRRTDYLGELKNPASGNATQRDDRRRLLNVERAPVHIRIPIPPQKPIKKTAPTPGFPLFYELETSNPFTYTSGANIQINNGEVAATEISHSENGPTLIIFFTHAAHYGYYFNAGDFEDPSVPDTFILHDSNVSWTLLGDIVFNSYDRLMAWYTTYDLLTPNEVTFQVDYPNLGWSGMTLTGAIIKEIRIAAFSFAPLATPLDILQSEVVNTSGADYSPSLVTSDSSDLLAALLVPSIGIKTGTYTYSYHAGAPTERRGVNRGSGSFTLIGFGDSTDAVGISLAAKMYHP